MPAVQPESSIQPPAQTLPEHSAPPQLTVPAAGHVGDDPVHVAGSVAEHAPPGHAQLGPLHCKPALPAMCWHAVDAPLHWSMVHGLLSVRQGAPALPAGAVHTPAWHWSAVHGLESNAQGVPLGFAGFEQTPVAGFHVPALWH